MGKKANHNPNQMLLDLKFKKRFTSFVESTNELQEKIESTDNEYLDGNDIAACFAVVRAIKKMMKEAGFSVEQMVDEINNYFCRSAKGLKEYPPACLKLLTVPYFKKYLSKPSEARIPAYYVFAIQAICDSLDLSKLFTEPMGGDVINADESRQLKIAKLQEAQRRAKELEKELQSMASY